MTRHEAERVADEARAAGYGDDQIRVFSHGGDAGWCVQIKDRGGRRDRFYSVAQWEAITGRAVPCVLCQAPAQPLYIVVGPQTVCLWLCPEHTARCQQDFGRWLADWTPSLAPGDP